MVIQADSAPCPMASDLAALLAEVQLRLQGKGWVVGTAESCTGGLLATYLTHLPGSSAVYAGGVSAYANQVKTTCLGVDPGLLAAHGAVSPEVAMAMARGICERLAVDVAVSLTGIAGPAGGSQLKPVGTVYCGIAVRGRHRAVRFQLTGDRGEVRQGAAVAALRELLTEIID